MAYVSNAEKFGMEKGIKKRNLEIVERSLEEGLKPTLVKKLTGLSLTQIKMLQQKLKQSINRTS